MQGTSFRTADGYEFRLIDGKWTDGDMTFDSGVDGKPVDESGEAVDGDFIPAMVKFDRHGANEGYVTFVGDFEGGAYYGARVPNGGKVVEAWTEGETDLPDWSRVPREFRMAVLDAIVGGVA